MVAVSAPEEPVTVVVTRRVKPGREADYERWLAELFDRAKTLPGYLGTSVQRPAPDGPREYTSVFKFDGIENLRAFETSDLRRTALAEVSDYVEADAVWERLTGLEFWFTPPAGLAVPQPSRLRMSLLLIVVVYGLVLSIGQVVALAMDGVAMPIRLLVTIALEVFVMTYWVMPRLTRWLAKWIYPRKL